MLVWIDFETSGLRPPAAVPLEVCLIVTDDDLAVLDHHTWLVHPLEPWENWPLEVQQMHLKNGLIVELKRYGGRPIPEVEAGMIDFLRSMGAEGMPLAGSSVGFDRKFLEAFFPSFNKLLHYRNVDVSSIKELAARWFPQTAAARPTIPDEEKEHRALPDLYASVAELAWYREHIFKDGLP